MEDMQHCDSCLVWLLNKEAMNMSCLHTFCPNCIYIENEVGICPLDKSMAQRISGNLLSSRMNLSEGEISEEEIQIEEIQIEEIQMEEIPNKEELLLHNVTFGQIESKGSHNRNIHTHIWTIKSFYYFYEQAKIGKKEILFSQPFYAGYRMCLLFCPNGIGCAKDKYMSAYFQIVRSKNDKYLDWPVKFKLKFTLVDQVNGNDYNYVLPRDKSIIYYPSRLGSRICRGEKYFFPLKNLGKYLKNDSIILKMQVEFI